MVTATDLRKNLFTLLDDAAQGQDVEVVHKGTKFRIVLASRGSRLARLIPRDADPAVELADLLSGWDEKAKAEWEAEQKELLGH